MKMEIKILNSPPKFLIYAILRSVRHPKQPIAYHYCPDCRLRFNIKENECPKCHDKVSQSLENKKESPIPWWGSVLVIIIGIGVWVMGACSNTPGLDEAGRALVYIPLGSLFGMSLR